MVNRRKQDFTYLGIFILAIIVINVVSSYVFTRIDFTSEKRYTLSPITKKILTNLKEDVHVTVYLEGEFPGGFKRLKSATRDMLLDYRSYSNNKVRFDFVNPSLGNADVQQQTYQDLVAKGLEPTNLNVSTDEGQSQKLIFPGALITYNGNQIPVKLLQTRMSESPDEQLNNSIQNLEYAFTSAIKKVTGSGKPRIGFTEGHGELNDLQLQDAMKSLADGYEVGRVDLSVMTFDGLNKLNVLIIPKPDRPFTEVEKYKIDYFVMKGGRVLWSIDNVNAELDSLRGHGDQLAFPKKLNLDDILFKYGVRINYNLIADMNAAQIPINVGTIGSESQMQMLPWLFYPIFIPMSKNPVVKNLDGIRSEFASVVDVIDVKGVKKEVILASSPYTQILKTPSLISLQMAGQEPDPKGFTNQPVPVGVLLEGEFSSDFSNRPVPEGITEKVNIPAKSKFTKMIVLGDGDIFKNQINSKDNSAFPLGYDRYTQQQFGNKNFLLNIADYLTDDSGIIELRNKEIKIRLLDKTRIKSEKLYWQTINIVLPILLIILFGAFQFYSRKQKYPR